MTPKHSTVLFLHPQRETTSTFISKYRNTLLLCLFVQHNMTVFQSRGFIWNSYDMFVFTLLQNFFLTYPLFKICLSTKGKS